jgi:hypothetical protein
VLAFVARLRGRTPVAEPEDACSVPGADGMEPQADD